MLDRALKNVHNKSMEKQLLFPTDQEECHDSTGRAGPCPVGQKRIGAGKPWPKPRFEVQEFTVQDRLTGLIWTKDAAESMFPLTWAESLDLVRRMNRVETFGFSDWRLPNRRELFSLLSHKMTNPALPEGHPFDNVFSGYYWSSTTMARLSAEAWYVNIGKGRVYTGMKHGSAMVWPVRGGEQGQVHVPWTGQKMCYTRSGKIEPCNGTGQDAELRRCVPWPSPRFTKSGDLVLDLLTGLEWTSNADHGGGPVDWDSAFEVVAKINQRELAGHADWRLPSIRELESITDMGSHSPAIAQEHPFKNVRLWYWSATTSAYDPSYAWTMESIDGKIGVVQKNSRECCVWAVR